jgi:hypothetical protein
MNIKKIQDCERSRIERWASFQLEYKWKKRGIIFSALLILALVVIRFLESDSDPSILSEYLAQKFILKKLLLIGLLVISLSKEKVEDEMLMSLRGKSFTLAFIIAVLYAVIQPFVNSVIFYLFDKDQMSPDYSLFQVLSFMLIIQLLFFEVLKKNR